MGKYSAKGGADFKPVSAGAHAAICTLVADIGIQPSGMFAPSRKIVFRFEIPGERVEYTDKDGNAKNAPAIIYDTLTASVNKKANMRAMLEGWRGVAFTDEEAEDFDTKNVLGAPCMISVVHATKDSKTYANISAVMKLPKGMPTPKAEGKVVYFHIDEDRSQEADLPKWVADKVAAAIKPTVESRAQVEDRLASEHGGFDDDDIPF